MSKKANKNGRRPAGMNMELLFELKHRKEVSRGWKWARRDVEVVPKRTRMEIGKPKLSSSKGCEGQPEGLLYIRW